MPRRAYALLFAAAISILPAQPALGAGFQRDDTQLWPDLTIGKQVGHGFGIFGDAQVQYSVQASAFINRILAGGVTWNNRHLSVSPYYRYISVLNVPDHHVIEHRFAVDITPHTTVRRFGLSDRSRIDVRWIGGVLSERYRNRAQVERAIGANGHAVTPYGAFEIFYDTRYHVWNRHRFYAGFKRALSSHVLLDSYFMRQLDGHATPGNLYTFGGGLKIQY